MITSKNPSQYTTPYTGGTTKASAVARCHRAGSRPRDSIQNIFKHILFNLHEIKVMAEEIGLSITRLLKNILRFTQL
jgi:hypothetical protein